MIPDPVRPPHSSFATGNPVDPTGGGTEIYPDPSHVRSNPFAEQFRLSWSKGDIEQRLGFRGGRFTSVNKSLTFTMGLIFSAAFYGSLLLVAQNWPDLRWLTAMFLERGVAPYFTMLLFFWGFAILFIKLRKLQFQAQVLSFSAIPQQPDFVLNSESAQAVLARVYSLEIGRAHV